MDDRGFARAQYRYDNMMPPEDHPCCQDAEEGEPCDCDERAEEHAEMMAEWRAECAAEDRYNDREEW